jgi:hypothetical protein
MAIQLAYSLQGLIWIKLRAPADARACWAVTLSTAICGGLPAHRVRAELLAISAPRDILDVYLNTKRDLLVVCNGLPNPLPDASGRWRKKKKVASVSEDIKLAVQRQGYYMRKLTDFNKC